MAQPYIYNYRPLRRWIPIFMDLWIVILTVAIVMLYLWNRWPKHIKIHQNNIILRICWISYMTMKIKSDSGKNVPLNLIISVMMFFMSPWLWRQRQWLDTQHFFFHLFQSHNNGRYYEQNTVCAVISSFTICSSISTPLLSWPSVSTIDRCESLVTTVTSFFLVSSRLATTTWNIGV